MAVGEEYHRHFSSLKQLLSIHSESHPRQQDREREREIQRKLWEAGTPTRQRRGRKSYPKRKRHFLFLICIYLFLFPRIFSALPKSLSFQLLTSLLQEEKRKNPKCFSLCILIKVRAFSALMFYCNCFSISFSVSWSSYKYTHTFIYV